MNQEIQAALAGLGFIRVTNLQIVSGGLVRRVLFPEGKFAGCYGCHRGYHVIVMADGQIWMSTSVNLEGSEKNRESTGPDLEYVLNLVFEGEPWGNEGVAEHVAPRSDEGILDYQLISRAFDAWWEPQPYIPSN